MIMVKGGIWNVDTRSKHDWPGQLCQCHMHPAIHRLVHTIGTF